MTLSRVAGTTPIAASCRSPRLRYADTKPRQTPTWFALDETRPLAFFPGIWTTWHGRRGTKANPVEGEHQLFGFLTTNADAEVGAIHPRPCACDPYLAGGY